MPTIDHRGSATQAFATGTSRQITLPATVGNNDLAFYYLYIENNTVQTITAPGGATELARETNTTTNPDFHVHVFWERLSSSDASQTRTFSWASSSGCSLGCSVFLDGITTGDPQDATKTFTTNAAGSLNLVAPDITPATQPHMETSHAASFGGPSSWTIPSGMTAYGFTSDTTGNAYLRRTTTSAPGVRTHVVNVSARWTAGHMLVKEATGGDARTGTVATSAGAQATDSGLKASAAALTARAGAQATETGRKAAAAAVTARAGASMTCSGVKGAASPATMRGGARATASGSAGGVDARSGAVAAHGGARATTSGFKAATSTTAARSGSRATDSGQKATAAALTARAGARSTASGTSSTVDARSGVASAHAGARATCAGRKICAAPVTASAGARSSALGRKGAASSTIASCGARGLATGLSARRSAIAARAGARMTVFRSTIAARDLVYQVGRPASRWDTRPPAARWDVGEAAGAQWAVHDARE